MLFNVDLPGGNTYQTYSSPNGDACQGTCESDSNCKAWTFVPPTEPDGYTCRLKDTLGYPYFYMMGWLSGIKGLGYF